MRSVVLTHNNGFHTDDVFAVAVLKLKLGDITILRSRREEDIKLADYVIDTGFIYDSKRKMFDHHQEGGAGKRNNGIPYASFGLVWKEFGAELSGGEREAEIIDTKLVSSIDARDNGVEIVEYKFENIRDYTIYDFFDSFLIKRGNTEEEFYSIFVKLVGIAEDILKREIEKARIVVMGRDIVLKIFEESTDKKIIVLPEDLPWKEVLVSKREPLFVVGQRSDGKWGARAIPDSLHSYKVKHPFPLAWAGKSDKELQTLSGVHDAAFCHKELFLAVAQSKEGAVALAQKALLG